MKANQIRYEFILLLRRAGDCQNFSMNQISGNILELSGAVDCLIYFKVRANSRRGRYEWGITKNRIDQLNQSGKSWVIVLLYEYY